MKEPSLTNSNLQRFLIIQTSRVGNNHHGYVTAPLYEREGEIRKNKTNENKSGMCVTFSSLIKFERGFNISLATLTQSQI